MSKMISQILFDQFKINASPGKRVKYPFCHHKTFSIMRDDTLGKCFHPSCGRFINQFHQGHRYGHRLYALHEAIFHDFHRALLDMSKDNGKNAYTYLVEGRQIHPQVVVDSMLGAVPQGKYDVDSKFAPLMEQAQASAKTAKKPNKGKPGGKRKSNYGTAQGQLAFLRQATDKLKACLKHRAGWLAFFYTDARHGIVAIRFRKPYSKDIVYYKPFKHAGGLFGHGLFSPYETPGLEQYNDLLIVTEGEFNQLQSQSMVLRYSDQLERPLGYLFACSVGGVGNADYRTIKKVAKHLVICYDNDTGGAGFKLVERAQELMSVTAFTTPEPDSDLDDYIRSFGKDHKAAWDAVKSLIDDWKVYPRSYEGVAKHICSIRANEGPKKLKGFEINHRIAETIMEDLKDRGVFYHDTQKPYFFQELEKKLFEIHPDDREFTLMLDRYGINRSEKIYNFLLEDLRAEAFKSGQRTEVHRLAYHDRETFTVYLFNNDGRIFRISPNSVELVDNGTDGVLFLTDPRTDTYELTGLKEEISWLDRTIVSQINLSEDCLTPNERRLIFTLWFYSQFFETIMPTKPILAFVGEKGSGKSITLRKVGMLLFGESFNVTPLPAKPEDFDAAVTNSPFLAIDNADTKCNWLEDKLAVLATGGTIRKRELYTTNKMVEIPVRCSLGITSRTPRFRRSDVAERLLIMRVDRFENFKPEGKLLNEVLENRDSIMSEVIHHIQEITRALEQFKDSDESSVFRLADFADFGIKIVKYAGIEAEVRAIFEKLRQEQAEFTLENDPLMDLIADFAEKHPGEEITSAKLCGELAEIADQMNMYFYFAGKPHAFAQRLGHILPELNEILDVYVHQYGGRKRTYSFSLKPE